MNKKPSFYIASKTKHADKWRKLRDSGANIISTWIDESGRDETEDRADLSRRCILESMSCDYMVVYKEADEILKGAFIEMGVALSTLRVEVYLVGSVLPEGNTFAASQFVKDGWDTVEEVIELIHSLQQWKS